MSCGQIEEHGRLSMSRSSPTRKLSIRHSRIAGYDPEPLFVAGAHKPSVNGSGLAAYILLASRLALKPCS